MNTEINEPPISTAVATKSFLTTPIYYASGSPHLGHAYTTFLASCYKRYRQLRGDEVLLATGSDEHGQKIERTAKRNEVATQRFVDKISHEFRQLWSDLDIQVDLFERTTASAHIQSVLNFWYRLTASGDIYPGEYSGLYCVECEQYFTEGKTCLIHKKLLEQFSETCWFFRLSRYQDKLIDHIESHPEFILPVQRRNEVLSFLKGEALRDLSVSRSSTKWGIPVPDDPELVLYVWIDALVAYVSALESATSEFESWWENAVHFIGKDILIFHAVYWPALLLSARLPLPRSLIVNGWLTIEGEKISKSNPKTIISPLDLTDKYSRDGLKYYLLRTVGLGSDVDYNSSHLHQTLNTDLANNLGNLVSRVVSLISKNHGGCLSRPKSGVNFNETLLVTVNEATKETEDAFSNFNFARGAEAFINCASAINGYLQQQQPWKITELDLQARILWVCCLAIRDVSILATPFVPELAQRIRLALGVNGTPRWDELGSEVECFEVQRGVVVFSRLD